MVELIYVGAILMAIGVFLPLFIWFIRNIVKYGYKKINFILEKVLRYSWLVGLLFFLLGVILIIIAAVA